MAISGIGSRSAQAVQNLVEMRRQLDDWQRQLSTGRKSMTYAGVGLDRGLSFGLRNQLSALEAYQSSIDNISVRLNAEQVSLGRLNEIQRDVKTATLQSNGVESNGTTIAQSTAYASLSEIFGVLNSQVGDRYMFSGRAVDQPSVEAFDVMMNGDGVRAGFKQVVTERRLADLGVGGMGRLVISAPLPTTVQVAEDVAGSPFGFKLLGINSAIANSTVAAPAGAPPAMSVDLTGLPSEGETVDFNFTLPDGTHEVIRLIATTSTSPGPDTFTIGATAAATAANMQATLTASIGKLASTSLVAASAVKAADSFFNGTPQRVAGPPFNTATALVAGTPANTVSWYTGENGPGTARATATAQVDTTITVSYGLRANEQGIRWMVQNVAALAAVTFAPGDPDAPLRSAALGTRVVTNLAVPSGTQSVEDIINEIALSERTTQSAAQRHHQTKNTLASMIEKVEGVSPEEAAASIMALQVRLQASLQTTSLMHQISLVNYL
jgi:flagellar hook-associated protein 3 FlgL